MTNTPVPTPVPLVSFEPVKYAACALPKEHPDYANYVVRVHYRPLHDGWEIFHAGAHGGKYLSVEGIWGTEGHFFDLDAARVLATQAALTVVVHGRTAADVIAADKSAVVR